MGNETANETAEHAIWDGEGESGEAAALKRLAARLLGKGAEPREYSRAVDRVCSILEQRSSALTRERELAPFLVTELLSLSPSQRLLRLRNSARYRTLAVGHLLLEKCSDNWFYDPPEAADMAELAVELAAQLGCAAYSRGMVEDLKALAWACLANCHRVRGNLLDAAQAMEMAEARLVCGSGDSLLEARVLGYKASLLRAQRRFAEGRQLLDRMIRLCQRVGAHHQAGRALLTKAQMLEEDGQPRQAIFLLRQAAAVIDHQAEPHLTFCLRHNLICCLLQQGEVRRAQRLLSLSRPIYDRFPELGVQMQLRWLEGRLAAQTGRRKQAEEAFVEARLGFKDLEKELDAALVSLDLADLLGRLGRIEEMKGTVQEVLPFFERAGLQRESKRARRLLERAARLESAARFRG